MKSIYDYQLGEAWALTGKERKFFEAFRSELAEEVECLKGILAYASEEIKKHYAELDEVDAILGKKNGGQK